MALFHWSFVSWMVHHALWFELNEAVIDFNFHLITRWKEEKKKKERKKDPPSKWKKLKEKWKEKDRAKNESMQWALIFVKCWIRCSAFSIRHSVCAVYLVSSHYYFNWFLILQLFYGRSRVRSHSYRLLNTMIIYQTNWIIDRIVCKWASGHANGFLTKIVQIQISNFICILKKTHKIANWFISLKHGRSQICPTHISIQTIQRKSFSMVIIVTCSSLHSFKWKAVRYFPFYWCEWQWTPQSQYIRER